MYFSVFPLPVYVKDQKQPDSRRKGGKEKWREGRRQEEREGGRERRRKRGMKASKRERYFDGLIL